MRRPRAARPHVDRSAFAGFRFPPEVITVAVRWYLRYGLSYRDVEELLAERGIDVDHVTVFRWVQRFAPLFADAARPTRHATGDRWFVDETYVKVAGRWRYLYRAVDQYGQVIDVLLCEQRDTAAARRLFARALLHGPAPVEVTTDQAGPYLRVLDELVPTAAHVTEQFSNNRIEADHARLKARLRPMRGLSRFRSAEVVASGHAFVQNLRRGLRTRNRGPTAAPPGNSIHRAGAGDVTSASSRLDTCPGTLNATDPQPASFSDDDGVTLWAPGVNVVSSFLHWTGPIAAHADGHEPADPAARDGRAHPAHPHPADQHDHDNSGGDDAVPHFAGWARWSGTSFAAPAVAGAIAAEIGKLADIREPRRRRYEGLHRILTNGRQVTVRSNDKILALQAAPAQ